MPRSYCERWNKMLATPIDPLSEDEARARHERGELYTVVFTRDDGTLSHVVEVRLENGFVGIWDFDLYRRPNWRRVLLQRGNRMFMDDAYTYDYGDSTHLLTINEAERFMHRHVEPDGTGFTIRRRKGDRVEERTAISLKEGYTLDAYWTSVPEFGDYDEVSLVGIDPADLDQAPRDSGLDDQA